MYKHLNGKFTDLLIGFYLMQRNPNYKTYYNEFQSITYDFQTIAAPGSH